jgi:hypothetical protein
MEQAAATQGRIPSGGAPPVPITRPVNEPQAREDVGRMDYDLPPPSSQMQRVTEPPALMRQPGQPTGLAGLVTPQGQRQESITALPVRPVQWDSRADAGGAQKPGGSYDDDEYAERGDAYEERWAERDPEGYEKAMLEGLGKSLMGYREKVAGEITSVFDKPPGYFDRPADEQAADEQTDDEKVSAAVSAKVIDLIERGPEGYFDEEALQDQYSQIDKWHAMEQEKLGAYLASKGISGSGAAAQGFMMLDAQAQGLKGDAYAAAQASANQQYETELKTFTDMWGYKFTAEANIKLAESQQKGTESTQWAADVTAMKKNLLTNLGAETWGTVASAYFDKKVKEGRDKGWDVNDILADIMAEMGDGTSPLIKVGTSIGTMPESLAAIEEIFGKMPAGDTWSDGDQFWLWAEQVVADYGISHFLFRKWLEDQGISIPQTGNASEYTKGYSS